MSELFAIYFLQFYSSSDSIYFLFFWWRKEGGRVSKEAVLPPGLLEIKEKEGQGDYTVTTSTASDCAFSLPFFYYPYRPLLITTWQTKCSLPLLPTHPISNFRERKPLYIQGRPQPGRAGLPSGVPTDLTESWYPTYLTYLDHAI